MRQGIIWTNAGRINWRMYLALGGDGLNSYNKFMIMQQKPVTPKSNQ